VLDPLYQLDRLHVLDRRHWEDDPGFDLDRHLLQVRLPRPGGDAELRAYLETQVVRPLDPKHPLWQLHLLEGYRGGGAVLARFHHALADGIALTHLLLSMTDDTPDGDLDVLAAIAPTPHQDGLLATAARVGAAATSTALGALHAVSELVHLPTAHGLLEALALPGQTALVADKLVLGSNPPTALSRPPGVAKRVTWSAPTDLARVKAAGRPDGATVNDVLVCAVSAGLGRYLVEHDGEAVDLSTMVPVNVRPADDPLPAELGNRFALVLLRLPIAARTPRERLRETKRRMDAIKHSPEAGLTFGLIAALGHIPEGIERRVVDFFAGKAIGVTTNVAGPTSTRYLAGSPLTGLLGWVPGTGPQTVGIAIVTYNGTVRVGFKVDAEAVPDPELLVTSYQAALDDLLDA
jgi:WS/DGAT/MGAT family acyltransferase